MSRWSELDADSQRRARRALILCALTVCILTVIGATVRRPQVERVLEKRVTAVIGLSKRPGVVVHANGRDIELSGVVSDDAERTEVIRLARTRVGVRVVHASKLRVGAIVGVTTPTTATKAAPGQPPPPIRKPLVDVSFSGGVMEIRGTAPTKAARDALLFRAEGVLGKEKTADKLIIPEKVSELPDLTEYRRVGDFLALLVKLGGVDLRLRYDRGNLSMGGTVGSSADLQLVQAEARKLVGSAKLDDSVTVVGVVESTLAGTTTGSTTTTASSDSTVPATPAVAAAQTRVDALVAGRVITFDKGSSGLTADGRAIVDEVAAGLVGSPDTFVIEVGGYTDTQGDAQKNRELSSARAITVRKRLLAKGVAADRVKAKGYGEANPVASDDTDAGRAKNRRIEFKVLTS